MFDLLHPHPFCSLSAWHGERLTADGTDTEGGLEDKDFVKEVVYSGESGDRWDGRAAAVVLLNDGRYVSWEANYGPTGNGFCEDAYGGDADVYFSSTLQVALRVLSEYGRELFPEEHRAHV